MNERRLLIDDTRDESSENIKMRLDVIARNQWEGMRQLLDNGPWDLLLLDHDLHSYDKDGKEWTGYHIASYLEEQAYNGNWSVIPKKIICVSSNPEGARRINVALSKIEELRK